MKKNDFADQLFDAVLTLENREELYMFFGDICTPKEIETYAQRFVVAKLLNEKKVYSDIVKSTGASTATISRVNKCISYGSGGYELVLERLKENKD